MLYKNKPVFIILVLTVVIINIFMISLLAYTLHTSREREEAQARTSVENLTFLLEKSVSSSSREIDLSLNTLRVYLEKELRDKQKIDDKELNALIQNKKIGSVLLREFTSPMQMVKSNLVIMILVL